ncbi:hypothetical protein BCR32DRAFT_289585 [Anaeromyces robustus]|uniref:EGF-like domain-containing protein n=1 Tax=Anaeromyces robustus TaxID=1754192 RepID=A0A1Y1XMT2_9FUNG|nr:hypothetical protein BCR32DRAFT_289585 [Anaeromyces robustus]|eukprot:ORX87048.1 hypothetical protein BCR32DRAFT_289585 [Anaeromyces robustus]
MIYNDWRNNDILNKYDFFRKRINETRFFNSYKDEYVDHSYSNDSLKKRQNGVINIDITKKNYSQFTEILYNKTLLKSELFINFVDKNYSGEQILENPSVFVYNNITFYSEKGATLDLSKLKPMSWFINFSFKTNASEKIYIKFENITFKNFLNALSITYMLYITPNGDNYEIMFNNCKFYNVGDLIVNAFTCSTYTKTDPNIIFQNCYFENNKNGILLFSRSALDITNSDESLCSRMYVVNSTFFNCGSIGSTASGLLTFDNCYFKKIKGSLGNVLFDVSVIDGMQKDSHVSVINSYFEDIEIENGVSVISISENKYNISNNYFKNCFSSGDNIITISSINSKLNPSNYIFENNIFENTDTIFRFINSNIQINKIHLKNYETKKTYPLLDISEDVTTGITINNSIFENIKFKINSLIGDIANYSLKNIMLMNITTVSKPIFHFNRKNYKFRNIYVKNLNGNGDMLDSTLFYYDSGSNYSGLNIKNMTVVNSRTNNPLIKIVGENSVFYLENLNITNAKTYGPLIENVSNNSTINIKNSYLINNRNTHIHKCGNIYMKNNINLKIHNSTFNDNNNGGFGGALCLDNIKNLNLEIKDSIFKNNYGLNGGALYLSNKDILDSSDLYNASLIIKNVNFYSNQAENFGGAIYSEYNKLYLSEVSNITFKNNSAFIAGGALYTPNKIESNLILNKEIQYDSNIAQSYGNNISTNPIYAILESEYKNDELIISSGGYLSFLFNLYDDQKNIIEDKTNYYNTILIKLTLFNDKNLYYHINGNVCNFMFGKCTLNNVKIVAIPGKYSLKFEIETNYNITIIADNFNVEITKCKDNEIEIYSRNGILSCETPICHDSCPVGSRATCISANIKNKNSPFINTCKCINGYTGINCDQVIFLNFGEAGTVLILFIFCIFIFYGYELGISDVLTCSDKIKYISSSFSKPEIDPSQKIRKDLLKSYYMEESNDSPDSSNEDIDLYEIQNSSSHYEKNSMTVQSEKIYTVESFNKMLTKLCSLNIELIVSYLVIILLSIISLIISYKYSYSELVKDNNMEWYYKFSIAKIDLFITMVSIIFMIILIIGVKKVWNNIYIFRSDKPKKYFITKTRNNETDEIMSIKMNNIKPKDLMEDYICLYKECSNFLKIKDGKVKLIVNKSNRCLPIENS